MEVLVEGIELANGEIATLKVGKPYDASALWDGVKDVCQPFFSDLTNVHDKESFARWFTECVDCACIGFVGGRPVACGYVTGVEPGYKATFHAFAAPEYRDPKITVPLAKIGMQYFRKQFELQRLETMGRNDNRVARLFAAMLGFEREGVLRRHGMHGGKWVDYYIGSIISA